MKKIIVAALLLSLCSAFALNGEPLIRVLIKNKATRARLALPGGAKITDEISGRKFRIKQAAEAGITAPSANTVKIGDMRFGETVRFSPPDGGRIKLNGEYHNGDIIVRAGEHEFLSVTEELKMEDYIGGVVVKEIGANCPDEALKAQAVSARSFALSEMKGLKKNFDVTAETRHQVYLSDWKKYPKIVKAVEETRGQILEYAGKPLPAFFHSNCGGLTSPPFWSSETITPLKGVICKYCYNGANYKWSLEIGRVKILEYLNSRGINAHKVKRISVYSKNRQGRAVLLKMATDNGSALIKAEDFRPFIGNNKFKSAYITRIAPSRNGFVFKGKGFGHGIGMCQEGAKKMAELGKTYREILALYYPDAQIKNLDY